MDGLLTWAFWKDALERSISTGVEVGMATIPVSTVLVQDIRWDVIGGAAALGALLALGKSIVASRIGRSNTASLVD